MNLISFVIPLYNEKENLPVLYKSLIKTIKNIPGKPLQAAKYEIIFINDGSTDGSLETIKKLAAKDPHIRISKSKNKYCFA